MIQQLTEKVVNGLKFRPNLLNIKELIKITNYKTVEDIQMLLFISKNPIRQKEFSEAIQPVHRESNGTNQMLFQRRSLVGPEAVSHTLIYVYYYLSIYYINLFYLKTPRKLLFDLF